MFFHRYTAARGSNPAFGHVLETDEVGLGFLLARVGNASPDREACRTRSPAPVDGGAEHCPDVLPQRASSPVHDVAFNGVRDLVADDGRQQRPAYRPLAEGR